MRLDNLRIGHIYELLKERNYFMPIIKSKNDKVLGINLQDSELLDIERQNLDYCDVVILYLLDGKYPLKLIDDDNYSFEIIEEYSIDFLDNSFPLDIIDIMKESIEKRDVKDMSVTFMKNVKIIVEDFLEIRIEHETR